MYRIEYAAGVIDDLKQMRAFDRSAILDGIEAELTHEPLLETRNKKILSGLVPPWEFVEPVRQLRLGEFRIFYDVDEAESAVHVRAIRHKPPHMTTEEIL